MLGCMMVRLEHIQAYLEHMKVILENTSKTVVEIVCHLSLERVVELKTEEVEGFKDRLRNRSNL